MYSELTPQERARVAFMRFGLGPKANGRKNLAASPDAARQALLDEIAAGPAPITANQIKVPSTANNGQYVSFSYGETCRCGMNLQMMPSTPSSNGNVPTEGVHNYIRPTPWDFQSAERALRLVKYQEPEVGFVERLVLFWVNHFSILSSKQGIIAATAGHLERTVIRQHALGNFADMLKGVMKHPAMITYLDNHVSYGPNSTLGRRWRATYNENLAREILELHTVGVYGGYTQADVIDLAKIITGWTIYKYNHASAGQFYFDNDLHEPGVFSVLGEEFDQTGEAQGTAALEYLARQPSTARHIAKKLLRHFVTENPTDDMVRVLEDAYLASNGNLKVVSTALVNLDGAWVKPGTGFRLPYEWMVSIVRGVGLTSAKSAAMEPAFDNITTNMSNQIWKHMTPDGYSDANYVWETPDAVRVRKDAAGHLLAAGTIWTDPRWKTTKPSALARQLLPHISAKAFSAIENLDRDPLQALNLLFVTPEYLRR
jgi:uncharacterized protein (DUF1800 family)